MTNLKICKDWTVQVFLKAQGYADNCKRSGCNIINNEGLDEKLNSIFGPKVPNVNGCY